MLFNSIDFAIFLPIVFAIYWAINRGALKIQNALLVLTSYIFYGWWDWRFLALIIFSSSVDFFVGKALSKTSVKHKRKTLLLVSIIANLGLLGVFKYYDFFVQSFVDAFTFMGVNLESNSLNIIIPVGISFYTFQTLSYTIDVYRRKLEPTNDAIAFFAFVSFFPQLVAGPIERATNLLPQFFKKRHFDYNKATDGIGQIIWGLFKKVVVADNCAIIANQVFDNYTQYSGSALALGAVAFAFQIYGDFSGYTDIAIGTGKLFGFNLKQNFAYPYFSRNIAEFWRRWHISLTSWFKDYVYIPLGGSKLGKTKAIRNIFIVFLISGLWHGANWTFVFWGLFNALLFIPLYLANRNRRYLNIVAIDRYIFSLRDFLSILTTFCLTTIGWIFFRAESITIALDYIKNMLNASLFSMPYVFRVGKLEAVLVLLFVLIMLSIEWIGRRKKYALSFSPNTNLWARWTVYYVIVVMIFLFGEKQQDFVYFQF
ncbi:MBOAT family O-acyltransferase [Winogradskyella sp. 3972H.M.0a.05]|uniref:MBOAT family O-acyltransferase n=1 Tax=Winogradskyella sp. 3972H.M.0a.05 TaxID=2950277 RepID=UPI003393FD7E